MSLQRRIEFVLFIILKWFILLLPLKSAQRLGTYLGLIAFYLVKKRRRIALDNLRWAFPTKSEQQRREIAKGAFKNYGITIAEFLWFPNLNDKIIRHLVKIKNLELILNSYKGGKGLVLLGGHFGNWELIALAVGYISKIPLTIIVQTQSNMLVNDVINRHRCLFGNWVVPRHKAAREILKTLERGGIVAIAPDQSAAMESLYVEFFGRNVSTHQGPAVFALRSGAPLQMGFMIRQSDGTYEVIFEEIPMADLQGYSDEHVLELTRRYTALLEKYIRQYPEHWLWMHRRWKHTLEKVSQTSISADRKKILVVQTAFLGDVILTLPLVQVLKRNYPTAEIDLVTVPTMLDVLSSHTDIHEIIVFDKRNKDSGIRGLLNTARKLRQKKYDIALVPHRSLRSAVLVWLARVPLRIGFDKSAGKFLFNRVVQYKSTEHEVERNLDFAQTLGIVVNKTEFPSLFPTSNDQKKVNEFLASMNFDDSKILIGIAPGTRWNTKRWLKERFAELAEQLAKQGYFVVLIGGNDDELLCQEIKKLLQCSNVISSAGKLSILQSAELINRCSVLVCNDSAPMHLAVAMQTPVVAIFGATVPEFGFAPYGRFDRIVETKGLLCRPCSIHGGKKCPVKTFDCMVKITVADVMKNVVDIIQQKLGNQQRRICN